MHNSALNTGRNFFEVYCNTSTPLTVVDIGSQDVNGSLRSVCQSTHKYIGVDFVQGKGVDVVLQEPYKYPFADNSVDVVVSSSCFEHSEFFWISFLECIRILKPSGLFYMNAPSNGPFHRYPVDCWRFYPDSGIALAKWGIANGNANLTLLESFVSQQDKGAAIDSKWNDFAAVFLKDASFKDQYQRRMSYTRNDLENVIGHTEGKIVNHQFLPQDQR